MRAGHVYGAQLRGRDLTVGEDGNLLPGSLRAVTTLSLGRNMYLEMAVGRGVTNNCGLERVVSIKINDTRVVLPKSIPFTTGVLDGLIVDYEESRKGMVVRLRKRDGLSMLHEYNLGNHDLYEQLRETTHMEIELSADPWPDTTTRFLDGNQPICMVDIELK